MTLFEAVEDFLPGQAFYQPDSRGAQGCMHGMPPDQGNAHVQGLTFVVQAEADAFQPLSFNVVSPQVGVG